MIKPVTDSLQLTRLKLAGYKSIQQLIDGNLQRHVGRQGGSDALLYYGCKTTDQLHVELYFGNNGYWLALDPQSIIG